MRVSATSRKSCDCGEVFVCEEIARDELRCQRSSNAARTRRRRSLFVKEIRSFSLGAVVIGVRCTSIRMCIVPTSPLIIAWRATWRRKRRRQRPRRRRRRRSRLRGLNDAIDSDVESSVAKTGEAKASERNASASGHAGSGRRRRASAKPRFILHGVWSFGPARSAGLRFSLI